ARSRRSPSTNSNRAHCPAGSEAWTISKLRRWPVRKLSTPITVWSNSIKRWTRWEPIKPPAPVTSQRRGAARSACWTSSYRDISVRALCFPNLLRVILRPGRHDVARVHDATGPLGQFPVVHAVMRGGDQHHIEGTDGFPVPLDGLSPRPVRVLPPGPNHRHPGIK